MKDRVKRDYDTPANDHSYVFISSESLASISVSLQSHEFPSFIYCTELPVLSNNDTEKLLLHQLLLMPFSKEQPILLK
jgi:hypothetical protein